MAYIRLLLLALMFVWTSTVLAGSSDDLIKAADQGNTVQVVMLLATGADVNAKDKFGGTALMYASRKGNVGVVKVLLLRGADVNAKREGSDFPGDSALIYAAESGPYNSANTDENPYLEIVRVLLAKGADINAKTHDGKTALIKASEMGRLKIVRELLSVKGIDVNARDSSNNRTALMQAIFNGQFDTAKELLLANGIDVNVQLKDTDSFSNVVYGDTALTAAVFIEDRPDLLQALLNTNGININAKDGHGNTALMLASSYGFLKYVQLLLGAKGIDVNARNNGGSTALIVALEHGSIGARRGGLDRGNYSAPPVIVQALLNAKGIDIEARDNAGISAQRQAAKYYPELEKMLLDKGAKVTSGQGASFDCEKASSKIEKMICGNIDLSRLDEELSNAYKTAMQSENKSEPTRQAQKKWIKVRNSCQDIDCVILTYLTRISELTSNSNSTNSTNVSGSENVPEIVTSTKATTVTAAQSKRPEYIYVVNGGSDNISAYLINAATGALTPVPGSPFGAGRMPGSFTVNVIGTFAYVPNILGGNISVFRINATNGGLTPAPGSPFDTGEGENPSSVVINPAGTFAYVVEGYPSAKGNGGGDVLAYHINATNGALTRVPGSSFAAKEDGEGPSLVEFNPAGTFVYVDHASTYRINADTGAVTPVSEDPPFSLGNFPPNSVMSNSAGTFVYKIENDADRSVKHKSGRPSEKITAYRVNTTTGGLTPIPDSSFATHGPASITVNPTGTFLYLVNTVYVANTANMVIMGDIPHELENGNITAFRINSATGALTPVRGGPFAEGKRPLSITINPTGTFAFVATQEDKWQGQQCSIQAYHIDSTTGALVHSTSNSSSAVPIFCFETIRIIQP